MEKEIQAAPAFLYWACRRYVFIWASIRAGTLQAVLVFLVCIVVLFAKDTISAGDAGIALIFVM